ESVVLDGQEARLVRPVLEQRSVGKQLVQPLPLVRRTEPTEQHEIWTARNDADRVDLEHAHATDRIEHVLPARTPSRAAVQALRVQMQPPCCGCGESQHVSEAMMAVAAPTAAWRRRPSGVPE